MNRLLLRVAMLGLVLVYLTIAVLQYRQYRATEEVMQRGDVNALWSFQQVGVEQHRLELVLLLHLADPQATPLSEVQLRYDILLSRLAGLSTGTPMMSASDCDTQLLTTMPPSMRSVVTGAAPSRVMASMRSRVWKQTDCKPAVTISPMPVSRVRPKMAPRACGSQYGAPRPVKAGTM